MSKACSKTFYRYICILLRTSTVTSKRYTDFLDLANKFPNDPVPISGCSNGIETISRMAVSFDLPHITYAGTSESLTNKKEFSRLSRISYTMDNFANFYMDVLSVSFVLNFCLLGLTSLKTLNTEISIYRTKFGMITFFTRL